MRAQRLDEVAPVGVGKPDVDDHRVSERALTSDIACSGGLDRGDREALLPRPRVTSEPELEIVFEHDNVRVEHGSSQYRANGARTCSEAVPRPLGCACEDRVNDRPHLVADMQASAPPVELALSRAGVTHVQKAIRIRRGDAETMMAAEIECTVDLARGQKGVHMSRFPEVFDEAIGDAVLGEARIVEEIAEVIARSIVERQRAVRAEVSDQRAMADAAGHAGDGAADPGDGVADRHRGGDGRGLAAGRRRRGDRDQRLPVRAGLVAGRAAERLADAGFDGGDIERILELVPIATHNQRGRGHVARRHRGTTSTPRRSSTSSSAR